MNMLWSLCTAEKKFPSIAGVYSSHRHFTGFLENSKFIFQAWKCPGILKSQGMSWKYPGKNIAWEKSQIQSPRIQIKPVT
jgi:hypothetical protein